MKITRTKKTEARYVEVLNFRVEFGMTHRLQAVLQADEKQGVVLRDLFMDWLLGREAKLAPRRKPG